ncbi:protein of unknown function DUF1740 [Macrophomina phaseolina MS6]|uniref:Uncharacterized protein n=1 Tax=Macrophomina phaseolina (strain MS6) TaxID=1126212 RepID=K2RID6_MACPH|nr:protein of unknown function DUF1740 [Macrophomina phaseolina MS6]
MSSPQPAKPSVPRFGSFKPKPQPSAPPTEPSPAPDDETRRRRREREHDRESSQSRRRHHRRRSHHDDRERRHRHRDGRGDRDQEKRQEHRTRESDATRRDLSAERRLDRTVPGRKKQAQPVTDDILYVSDRKGDLANLHYGRLHQYSVPAYRRAGLGSVLGLPPFARIDRFVSDDRTIVIDLQGRRAGSERQLISKRLLGRETPILRVIKPSESQPPLEFDTGADFIPVRGAKRKRGSETPEPGAETTDYRSIEGKAKPSNQPEDSDLEYASDAAGASSNQDYFSETKERNALLTRRVQDDPKDLQAWLDLVEHQESMIRIGSSDVHRHMKATELHALASLRFDIYQRALKAVHSERLILGLMEESSKIHQREEHFSRWRQVLAENPGSTSLWIRYLDTLQTNLAEFHFEECRSKFLDCLKIVAETGTDDSQKLSIYVFLRLTSLMRHAGYHEKAIALWQALLEFQVFRPAYEVNTPSATMLNDFEEFWESECPRLGEPGAKGWRTFYDEGAFPDPPTKTIHRSEGEISLRRVFETFCLEEKRRASSLQWPGRTTDEFGEDDPFHVVLFSDIRSELELLKGQLSPTLLVEAFLCFWGLPSLPSDLQTRAWWLDPFLRAEILYAGQPRSLLLAGPDSDEADTRSELHNWRPPVANFQVTTEELFGDEAFASTHTQEQKDWLSRCLKALAHSIPDDAVAEYFLAFEWHCKPTGASKAAKALLKKRSSSLRLYNAYALIESRSERKAEADRVFSMALGMSSQLPPVSSKFKVLLWRTWVWEALRIWDLRAAKHRISLIGDAKPILQTQTEEGGKDPSHPATMLKVRNTLTEGRDHSVSLGDTILAVYHAECLAIFTYLHSQCDITAALEPLRDISSVLQSRGLINSAANEIAHQAQCQMISYHSKHVKLFKPVITRSVVQESIKFFPNNTKFLAIYAANEARFRVDDRVRAIMQDVVLHKGDQSIVGWFFAVYSELKRGENLGGTTHAVRAAFERAVESDSGQKSSALWTSFVLYLCAISEHVAAKRTFFRGLLHVPYSKSYIMLAFEHLAGEMDFKELRSVYNTLQEKELRVHVEIEEELEEVQRVIDRRRRSMQALD